MPVAYGGEAARVADATDARVVVVAVVGGTAGTAAAAYVRGRPVRDAVEWALDGVGLTPGTVYRQRVRLALQILMGAKVTRAQLLQRAAMADVVDG